MTLRPGATCKPRPVPPRTAPAAKATVTPLFPLPSFAEQRCENCGASCVLEGACFGFGPIPERGLPPPRSWCSLACHAVSAKRNPAA